MAARSQTLCVTLRNSVMQPNDVIAPAGDGRAQLEMRMVASNQGGWHGLEAPDGAILDGSGKLGYLPTKDDSSGVVLISNLTLTTNFLFARSTMKLHISLYTFHSTV